ncbi:MAG: ribose-phosphate diphosphokinase [bacterium]|nr:ribose-phosphate diphosphokinase [bacterium]
MSSKNNIRVFSSNDTGVTELDIQFWDFPGGEVGVRLDPDNEKFALNALDIMVSARIRDPKDIIRLIMVNDALNRFIGTIKTKYLFLPYFPYSRQDRVDSLNSCGEALSVSVMAGIINNLHFNKVFVADCHSDVTRALVKNMNELPQWALIANWAEFKTVLKDAQLVSCDAGANKKISDLAKRLGKDSFIRADKKRDIATGEILETVVFADNLNSQVVAIVDDICDGGKTFLELAKVLKAKNAGKIILFVTHGIFSKGTSALFDGGIDEIWTTNSFRSDISDPRVQVLNLDKVVLQLDV